MLFAMDFVVIALTALVASGLTLFSGFGLGTLLMPVVAIFFPVEVAIGVTALVHFANNLFKLGLLGLRADRNVLTRFGIPAVLAAFAGALLLGWLAALPPLLEYHLGGGVRQLLPVKFAVGLLILIFVLLELSPAFARLTFDRRWLPLGGFISGFFGGLSGHQGALRSMFLIKAGLDKEQFVATGVVLAVMVDLARLSIYGGGTLLAGRSVDWPLVATATLAAFAGAFAGTRLLKKLTILTVQLCVAGMLTVVALGLMTGLL